MDWTESFVDPEEGWLEIYDSNCCLVSARAVTGEDGRLLVDDVDVSTLFSGPRKEPERKPSKEESEYLPDGKPWNPRGMPELSPIQPPRQPLRVRNTVTGHEFAWHPLLTLSENDDLEVIA